MKNNVLTLEKHRKNGSYPEIGQDIKCYAEFFFEPKIEIYLLWQKQGNRSTLGYEYGKIRLINQLLLEPRG